MYHMYEAEIKDEGFDWHIYAENHENALEMVISFNDFMTRECRKLAKSLQYECNVSELKSEVMHGGEKQEIKKFFSQFGRPFVSKKGIQGGYVLDYRQCSVRKNVEMPYKIMLSYLNTVQDRNFFDFIQLNPVYACQHEIYLPDHDVNIQLKIGMDLRYTYGNEALLSAAGGALDFRPVYSGKDLYGWKDLFVVKLKNAQCFCQFLNYFPFVDIYDVSCP